MVTADKVMFEPGERWRAHGLMFVPMQFAETTERRLDRPNWRRNTPFWGVHVAAVIGAIWIGWSWTALAWLAGGYLVRMFAITGGYHRYFAHRTFKTSRAFQFVLALLGMSTAQQGPLWWAAHHRRHHKHSDEPGDVHSPRQRGFVWSHVGWILGDRHTQTDFERIKDLARYPELRFMNRHDTSFVVGFSVLLFLIGGPTALVWGGFVPLVLCWHATFCINSLAHVWGWRRYATSDDSRNNFLLALLTLGEGWHNNHHHYQRSARQGFYWWEIDISYYVLKLLEQLRLVWDVEGVPRHIRDGTSRPPRTDLEAPAPETPA
jgi:stearoyl-CoA desaturase (delta-9 desaturase)